MYILIIQLLADPPLQIAEFRWHPKINKGIIPQIINALALFSLASVSILWANTWKTKWCRPFSVAEASMSPNWVIALNQ
jgi:hypothetical protein